MAVFLNFSLSFLMVTETSPGGGRRGWEVCGTVTVL